MFGREALGSINHCVWLYAIITIPSVTALKEEGGYRYHIRREADEKSGTQEGRSNCAKCLRRLGHIGKIGNLKCINRFHLVYNL